MQCMGECLTLGILDEHLTIGIPLVPAAARLFAQHFACPPSRAFAPRFCKVGDVTTTRTIVRVPCVPSAAVFALTIFLLRQSAHHVPARRGSRSFRCEPTLTSLSPDGLDCSIKVASPLHVIWQPGRIIS